MGIHIETRSLEREGQAITNFALQLPVPQSDLVRNLLKDPYVFDFLNIGDEANERAIETATDQDGPTIGLLLCKTRNRLVVEYALRDINKPMGVAEYQLTTALPDELQSSLPTIEQIERELGLTGHRPRGD